MMKLSKKATLHMMLQGLWRGIQKAKNDPLVQKKYPKGLKWFEDLVMDLGQRAKNPNFRLSEKQVKILNKFLSGTSGILSPILRREIVLHCDGNHCEMVNPSEFRFVYKPDLGIKPEAEVKSLKQVKADMWKEESRKKSHRDDSTHSWQEVGQSFAEFQKASGEQYRGYPGFLRFYFDPTEGKHFAFMRYNTF